MSNLRNGNHGLQTALSWKELASKVAKTDAKDYGLIVIALSILTGTKKGGLIEGEMLHAVFDYAVASLVIWTPVLTIYKHIRKSRKTRTASERLPSARG